MQNCLLKVSLFLLGFLALIILGTAGAEAQDDTGDIMAEISAMSEACRQIDPATEASTACRQRCFTAGTMLRRAPDSPMALQQAENCRAEFETSGAILPELNSVDPMILRAEAVQKSDECGSVVERNRATTRCVRGCNSAANLMGASQGRDPLAAQRMITECRNLYLAAGFSDGTAPVLRPSQDQQIAAMPGKAAYCAAQFQTMTCAYGDFHDRMGLCASARMCEGTCAHPNMREDLNSSDRMVRIKATQDMARCDENYERAKTLLGD